MICEVVDASRMGGSGAKQETVRRNTPLRCSAHGTAECGFLGLIEVKASVV